MNLFNYENQKLSAEGLRLVNSFNSYNYAGIVGTKSPFSYHGFRATLEASETNPVVVLGGGLVFTFTESIDISLNAPQRLAYIKVTLDDRYGKIYTDEYEGATVEIANCTYASFDNPYTIYSLISEAEGNPSAQEYYEYNNGVYFLSEDSDVDPSKTYYFKYESSSFTFKADNLSSKTYKYNGNTLWISENTFIIPLILRIDSDIKEVFALKDLRDIESFLSLEAYAKLRAYCDGTFVWSEGGEDEVVAPDGTVHRKGDIGNLNITNGTIRNNQEGGKAAVNITNLSIENLSDFDKDKDRLIADGGRLLIDKDYIIPISQGGTSAVNRSDAKKNLGIYYGTLDPSNTYPVSQPSEGDIYLKIVE